jgi:putative endopeptidase
MTALDRFLPRRELLALVLLAFGAARAQQPANKALDRANLDTTCAACQDFYSFANGGWLKHNTIPAAYTSWGAFEALQDKNQDVVHDILESEASAVRAGKAAARSNNFKIGAFYDACMDTVAIEKLGTTPLKASLARIAAIKSAADLPAAISELESSDGLAPFGVGPGQDFKNSSRLIAQAGQGGLNLPDRDYYLKDDGGKKEIRDAYVAHVANMLRLLGETDADANAHAQTILAIETKFAQASMDRVMMRNPDNVYHLMTVAQFDSLTPHMKWAAFLAKQGAPPVKELNVVAPDFFKAMDGFYTSIPVEDWKTLLRWRLVHFNAGALPKRFADEDFAFSKRLTGAKEQLPRWKRCTRGTDGVLGEAIGQEYVKRTFSPEAKARAKSIVDNMVSVLRERIGQLDWMSAATKTQALAKLDAFTRKIGYPDKWRDYSKLEVKRGEYERNLHRATDWSQAVAWAKVGKPIDKTEWGMTPPTVNAYYNPLENNINFPAGILQPPFYGAGRDAAINYGGAGAVIGHELTHGFDDQGRQFDANGNLKDWWTPDDAAAYQQRSSCLVDQYSGFTAIDDVKLNGKLTLGENTADNGGLRLALMAYLGSDAAKSAATIEGFTPEQRVFLGWAGVWCENRRPEYERLQAQTNPHSPGRYRVNGVLSNMPEFQKAFSCKSDAPMVSKSACRVW